MTYVLAAVVLLAAQGKESLVDVPCPLMISVDQRSLAV